MKEFRVDRAVGCVYVYETKQNAFCYLTSFGAIGAKYSDSDKLIKGKAQDCYNKACSGSEEAHYDC